MGPVNVNDEGDGMGICKLVYMFLGKRGVETGKMRGMGQGGWLACFEAVKVDQGQD